MTVLIAIIYATFISLGLPDTVVGAAWPKMASDLSADPASAGFISMTTTFCTIISSFSSGYLLKRFGTYKVAAFSILLTSLSLVGYAMSPNFFWLILFTIPLGLGGGAIDAAMNSYAAIHFSAKHMNFLHGCWGIGASAGPLIVGFFLNRSEEWRPAYWVIAAIQFLLFLFFLRSHSIWQQNSGTGVTGTDTSTPDAHDVPSPDPHSLGTESPEKLGDHQAADGAGSDRTVAVTTGSYALSVPWYKIPGIIPAFFAFFCYSAVEVSSGLWASTFLAEHHGLSEDFAALGTGALFIGVTAGRFLSGIMSTWWSNIKLLRIAFLLSSLGFVAVIVLSNAYLAIAALALVGVGFAPVYPTVIKETSRRFGAHNTERLMGMQMGFAYTGQTVLPPLTGFLITRSSPLWFPVLMLIGVLLIAVMTEKVERSVRARDGQ